MKIAGGYDKFIELPIPAFFEIMKILEDKAKLEEKELKKHKKH